MDQTWIFRVASSPAVGAGHVMRCITLAKAMPATCKVRFLLCADGNKWMPVVRAAKFEASIFDGLFVEKCFGVVIDGYFFSEDEITVFRNACEKLVMFQDTPTQIRQADLILGPSLPKEYFSPADGKQIVLAGPKYALVGQAYDNITYLSQFNLPFRILLSCGYADTKNLCGLVLALLNDAEFKGIVDVAVGPAAQYLESVRTISSSYSFQINWHVGLTDLSHLVSICTLCIGTGGVSLLERMSAGVPSITLVAAENQKPIATWAAQKGATYSLDHDDVEIKARFLKVFSHLCKNENARLKMSRHARSIIDKNGRNRIVAIMTAKASKATCI